MPERPDLEYVVAVLSEELSSRKIVDFSSPQPVVLRLALPGDPADLQRGFRIAGVRRQLHFVRIALVAPRARKVSRELVISPMLAGVFDIREQDKRIPKDAAAVWLLDDGRRLLYRDNKRMGKVYLIAHGDEGRVPGLHHDALDVLDPQRFSAEAFCRLARKRRDQVRVFLMDKKTLDAMGNAYADEVLFAAGIHPKAWVRSLTDEELLRLHHCIISVISEAVRTIATRKPALCEKVRDFLKVRGKGGLPCPNCGETIRRAGVRGYDAYFCPHCQPDGRGTGIVDWRRRGQ